MKSFQVCCKILLNSMKTEHNLGISVDKKENFTVDPKKHKEIFLELLQRKKIKEITKPGDSGGINLNYSYREIT